MLTSNWSMLFKKCLRQAARTKQETLQPSVEEVQQSVNLPPLYDFLLATKIENPQSLTGSLPFELWPAQQEALKQFEGSQKVIFIKARQIGITWTICGYALWLALSSVNRKIFVLSKTVEDAQTVIDRFEFMYHHHALALPKIVKSNTSTLAFENNSVIKAIAATEKAGRSLTGSLVILDEFAFMKNPKSTFAAVQPTINDGGKLVIISTADGNGTYFHSLVQSAGNTDMKLIFLPWQVRPDRASDFREKLLSDASNDPVDILKEYPESIQEAFTAASGSVYERAWSPLENVKSIDYDPSHGRVLFFVDDGYSAGEHKATYGIDPSTGTYGPQAHPRVFLLVQERNDGQLIVFNESYACLKFEDEHIDEVLAMSPVLPDLVVYDKSAAQLKGRLMAKQLYVQSSVANVKESIKNLRRMLAADANGWRAIVVHPRCKHLLSEMANYRYKYGSDDPQKFFDHGPDALRYGAWLYRQKES